MKEETTQIEFRNKTIRYVFRPDYWKSIESHTWEPETFDVLDRYVKPGVTVIDIGAWQGAISIYSRLLGAHTYSIEPDPAAYYELVANLSANGIDGFASSYKVGISDFNGEAELNSMATEFGNSESSLVNRGLINSSVTTNVYTLSDFLKYLNVTITPTDLIKIDIEGGEAACLRGCIDFIKEHKPTLYLALHPSWIPNFDEFVEWIIQELFPIYHVINPRNMGVYLQSVDFKREIDSMNHAFVFTIC